MTDSQSVTLPRYVQNCIDRGLPYPPRKAIKNPGKRDKVSFHVELSDYVVEWIFNRLEQLESLCVYRKSADGLRNADTKQRQIALRLVKNANSQ